MKLKYLLLIFLYVASIPSANSKPLKIFSGEWPPYSSKNLPRGGVALSIISEAFANVDVTVEYVWAPWKRGFEGAKSGHEVFASSLWMKNDEREKHFYYTEPFIDQEHVFFHLKSKPIKWKKFSDLSDKGVLVVRGYSYGDLDGPLKNKQFKQIENTEGDFQAFQMLLGRSTVYDILPSNKLVGLTTLKMKFSKQDIDKITFNPRTFGVDPLHLIFRKDPKFKKYVDLFNKGLSKLKKSGRHKALLDSAEAS